MASIKTPVNESKKRNLVIASNNPHKIQEISACLGENWNIFGPSHFAANIIWDETGGSFLENARIKMNALLKVASQREKFCFLADDSGLCVEALHGGPGVQSSSFGGVEGDHARNLARLLEVMKTVPSTNRNAYFYCLLLFVDEAGKEFKFEGRCDGVILSESTGSQGFGYDPVFYVPEKKRTMAELSEAEKNAISHRGKAMEALRHSERSEESP